MSDSSSQFPEISFNEVFKRIKAGATVVTPNRRLASALKDKFNIHQIDQKVAAWQSADVLPFTALIERIYLDAQYAGQSADLPVLLTVIQERALWESIIQSSDAGRALLRIPQTAAWVHEAWQLAHSWQFFPRLNNFLPNEDGRAFLEWAKSYEQATARNRQIDHARIGDLLIRQYEHLDIRKPADLICYGFDVLTPQQKMFLAKLEATGCKVVQASPLSGSRSQQNGVKRVPFLNKETEIYQAATWARARVEADSTASIGIVVPTLTSDRAAIIRIFNSVLLPDIKQALPGAAHTVAPFNISLGMALTTYPIIDAALTILELIGHEMAFERVSQLIRSPFLAGGEVEMSSRARLDARIRRYAEPVMTLDRWVSLAQQAGGQASCPILMRCLSSFVAFRQTTLPDSETHAAFAKLFPRLLQIVGFPGERSLDSTEYQTVKKWHEVIAGFTTLDSVLPEIRYADGIRRLRQIAGETLFQPQTPDVPIQILGVLEAAGMTFDHLWVMGLTDEQWPLRPRPNPFLPFVLQQQAKLPLGSTQASLDYSRQLTNGWLAGAKEVILSYSQYSDDRDGHPLEPSPLIQSVAEDSLALPVYKRHLDLIIQAGTLERIEDDQAVPLSKGIVKGGTAVIRDYAACPFRAWAKHRMNAVQLDVPHVGLNAMERGVLVHDVLAQVWNQLKTREMLEATNDEVLEGILAKAVDKAIQKIRSGRPDVLPGRVAGIEQRRLMRLVREWLATEKERADFTVIATEDKREIHVDELIFRARLDRIDELADGKRIVIDYKTKKLSMNATLGERPDEPQLPLYLVMTDVDAIGIAFASVKLGQMGFSAILRDPDLLPGIKAFSESSGSKQYESWDALIAAWQQDLTNLAHGFSRGDARVNPKNYPATCEFCDMQSFCRVHERINGDIVEQGDANE